MGKTKRTDEFRLEAGSDGAPVQAVDNPILNNPYDEPARHWIYKDKRPFEQSGRRPASYYFKTQRTGSSQIELIAEEERDDLPLVNRLRKDVKRWREAGWRGASRTTKDLLRHWADPERPRRLFFCQIEAAETLIYLLELGLPGRLGASGYKTFEVDPAALAALLAGSPPDFPELKDPAAYFPRLVDPPADDALLPLTRMGCKMATGSGKTIVMAMLVAWAFCNSGVNPASRCFPNAVLICAPNLTVKSRLQVLRPDFDGNYYDLFGLVPPAYREHLNSGRVLVTNWHVFAPSSEHAEGGASYKVVDKGEESAEAFAQNRLAELAERLPLLVLNDEGHHCWRPNRDDGEAGEDLSAEEKEARKSEEEEARVWLTGLDRINNSGLAGSGKPGILACVDLSATPFYLAGSGHIEGSPFPWLVSDFGLVDTIECGIVKVPRLPVKDEKGKTDDAGQPDPEYFKLWDHVLEKLSPKDFIKHRPKPEAVYRTAQPALAMLYSQWKQHFDRVVASVKDKVPIPPVMIVVCENTDLAKVFFENISGERTAEDGTVIRTASDFPEFQNTETQTNTFRIDTKLLAKVETQEGETKDKAAQALRELINSVGVRGRPGEQVRCVVSVSMLTEGWDANNVTHVLGLRPFRSQLLCEQVVGRGLRRTSYTPDPVTKLLPAEYVDVYGIPFSLIPFKGRPKDGPENGDPVYHQVHPEAGREDFEIRVPLVEGYSYALKAGGIRCDVASMPELFVTDDPTKVYLAVTKGYAEGAVRLDEKDYVEQTKEEFYKTVRLQQIVFRIAQDIVRILEEGQDEKKVYISRHRLFPEVVDILEKYVATRVRLAPGVDLREIALQKHAERIKSLLCDAIRPAAASEEAPLVPILNRFKTTVSTRDVNERTARPVVPLEKSHLNYAVVMSGDESKAVEALEASPHVECFVANTRHLGLQIPYEYDGNQANYIPDFIIRLAKKENGLPCYLVLEIKGGGGNREPNQVAAKSAAAQKWAAALTNLKRYGVWRYDICYAPEKIPLLLAQHAGKEAESSFPWTEVLAELRKPWENCLPVVSLKTVATPGDAGQLDFENNPAWAETWVRPKASFAYEKGMFIAQVRGDAMAPLIPAGAWCVFRPPKPGMKDGKVLVVAHSGIKDPAAGGQYTVRTYRTENAPDPKQGTYRKRIVLEPINRDYENIVLEPRSEEEVRIVAEWAKVLR